MFVGYQHNHPQLMCNQEQTLEVEYVFHAYELDAWLLTMPSKTNEVLSVPPPQRRDDGLSEPRIKSQQVKGHLVESSY